ncbi:hypothetical protein THS27_05220 [Thalassospira sp. MCCC 1A01428]|nr:hypothetical protein THS27_05220 [Thalassospira sp. MCCC 1A01428]
MIILPRPDTQTKKPHPVAKRWSTQRCKIFSFGGVLLVPANVQVSDCRFTGVASWTMQKTPLYLTRE